MTCLRLLCALALLTLFAPAAARAQIPEGVQRVLLLVVGNDGPASVRRAERVFQHELESRQLEVVVQREPEQRPGELQVVDSCISGPCLEQRLSEAHAQLLVGLGAWLQRDQPQIILTLDDGHGPANVSEPFEPGESDAHFARRVFDQALHLYHGRDGVPLRVEGTPHGASVVIDHRPLGTLPLVTHLPPGPHNITVAHVDYVTQRRHVELGADGDELTITLERETGGADVTPPDAGAQGPAAASGDTRERQHPIVGPVLLAGAGAVGIAWGASALLRSGCADRGPAGDCLRTDRVNTAPVSIAMIGGGLAIVGALLWFSLGGREDAAEPEVSVAIGPQSVRLRVQY